MPSPGEVDDRVDAFERGRIDASGFGIPADLVVAGDPAADESQHAMTVASQRCRERGTQQAARAR